MDFLEVVLRIMKLSQVVSRAEYFPADLIITAFGTTPVPCDRTTRSANRIGSSLSTNASSLISGLIELRAFSSAPRTGVDRQFARAALLIVSAITLPSAELVFKIRSEGAVR